MIKNIPIIEKQWAHKEFIATLLLIFAIAGVLGTGKQYYNFKSTSGSSQSAEIVAGGEGIKTPEGNVWFRET